MARATHLNHPIGRRCSEARAWRPSHLQPPRTCSVVSRLVAWRPSQRTCSVVEVRGALDGMGCPASGSGGLDRLVGRGPAHTESWVAGQMACSAYPHVWEAPMFTERTSVGLDVHALSVRAAGLDTITGQLVQETLTPSPDHVSDWLRRLPQPVATIYEAGPTGFGLYRALDAAGIRCEVVAPSKLIRPAGVRVKTDQRDAIHLARLLHLDEYTPGRGALARAGDGPGLGPCPGAVSWGSDAGSAPVEQAVAAVRDRLQRRQAVDREALAVALTSSNA